MITDERCTGAILEPVMGAVWMKTQSVICSVTCTSTHMIPATFKHHTVTVSTEQIQHVAWQQRHGPSGVCLLFFQLGKQLSKVFSFQFCHCDKVIWGCVGQGRKGLFWFTLPEEAQSIVVGKPWQRVCEASRTVSRELTLHPHIESRESQSETERPTENEKWVLTIKPQNTPPVIYFLQQSSTS